MSVTLTDEILLFVFVYVTKNFSEQKGYQDLHADPSYLTDLFQ